MRGGPTATNSSAWSTPESSPMGNTAPAALGSMTLMPIVCGTLLG